MPVRAVSRRAALPGVLAAVAVLLAACSGGSGGSEDAAPQPARPSTTGASPAPSPAPSPPVTTSAAPSATPSASAAVRLRVTGTVVGGLDSPWGLAFLPDGSALVSQRDDGRVLRVADGRATRVGTVDGVVHDGEAGLLGLAVSPDFATDHYLYAYYTSARDNRVVRMRYTGGRLGPQQVLLDGLRKAGNHDGGRIAFGPDGMLYVAVGDANDSARAQDRTALNGKILRLRPDGSVPADNPFPGSPVWSLGHRNVQGLAWDDQGRLWASEFGQNTWDELNLIRPGKNYGWPVVEGRSGRSGFVDPVAQWNTDDASPSGLAVVGGNAYLAALRGQRLWQVPLDGARAGGASIAWFRGEYGRLRTIAAAPDGSLWLVTSNTDGRGDPGRDDDRILRVTLS